MGYVRRPELVNDQNGSPLFLRRVSGPGRVSSTVELAVAKLHKR
jgi:hypothetical protein